MNMMKKLVLFFLALTLVLSVSVGALATSTIPALDNDGVNGEFTQPDKAEPQGNAVLIYKVINVFNQSSTAVNAPTITYEYTIAPATVSGLTVTDAGGSLHATQNEVTGQVKAGVGSPTISGTTDKTPTSSSTFEAGKLVLTPSVELEASASGAENKFPLKVDFTGVTWPGAGVYRYVITETTSADTKKAAGIAEAVTTKTNYMDVYVMDAEEGSGYVVYGYVLHTDNTNNITPSTSKSSKIAADDNYYTFDLTISKTLVGDNANKTHKFPFNVDFTNSEITAVIGLIQNTETGNGITATAPSNAAVSSLDVSTTNLQLADGASVTYIGIPVGVGEEKTTVTVYEINDVVGTVYGSTYKVDTGNETGYKQLSWVSDENANQSNLATVTPAAVNAHDGDSTHTIAFTNTLELISPTGVVLRIAPYALILGAGIVLLLISRRRKAVREEE